MFLVYVYTEDISKFRKSVIDNKDENSEVMLESVGNIDERQNENEIWTD